MNKEEKRIRFSGYGTSPDGYYIKLEGLTADELKIVKGMIKGHYWTKTENGRLVNQLVTEPLPDPLLDEDLLPFWRAYHPSQENPGQMKLFSFGEVKPCRSNTENCYSFLISYLCGYNYSPESYQEQARRLNGFGFECLRSRRGADGSFREVWRLGSLLFAQGELKKAVDEVPKERKIEGAINFLCRNVSFGTLDLAWQRAAMTID